MNALFGTGTIKDYEVLRPLGIGAYSKVYQVRHRFSSQEFALKIIEKNKMTAGKLRKRLNNEVSLQVSLNHPCIVRLFNTFEDDELIYLLLEMCSGGELFAKIKEEGRLDEEDTRSLCSQIVQGIEYLHTLGIIHRDLKLGNLLLSEDRSLVKIADFGLAVRLKSFTEERNTMCGTPNYISPEIINRQPYGLASDMWSFGCIVYACLTGSPPFESASIRDTFLKANDLKYSLPSFLSNQARDLISGLLTWDAEQRLTVNQVKQHPFFSGIFGLNLSILSPVNRSEVIFAEYSEQMVSPVKTRSKKPANNSGKSQGRALAVRKKMNEGVLPLTTSNLGLSLPFVHPLKDGLLEIIETGEILLTIRGKEMKVIKNGNEVIYEGKRMKITELDKHCLKLYKYLGNVLEVIRSKTPKVTVELTNAICKLMWNAPPPYYEVDFNDGKRLVMRVGSDLVNISTSDQEIEVSITQDYDYLDMSLKSIIDTAMTGLKLCFEEEKKLPCLILVNI
jgi:serine/threonine protein kinase